MAYNWSRDEYQSISSEQGTATSNLPNFRKRSNDFYVAILWYKKSVRTGQWEDLLWLRVPGTHTIAQVKRFYKKTTGVNVLFVDGGSVVPEHTQVQSLKHLEANLVALWTVNAEREPLGDTSSARQNASASKIRRQEDAVREDLNFAKYATPKYVPTLEMVKHEISQACPKYPGSILKVEQRPELLLRCPDCPDFGRYIGKRTDLANIKMHLDDLQHQAGVRERLRKIGILELCLGAINENEPRSKFTTSFGADNFSPAPDIHCSICPNWVHIMTTVHSVAHAVAIIKAHAVSSKHKANLALLSSSWPGPARSKSVASVLEAYRAGQKLLKRKQETSNDHSDLPNPPSNPYASQNTSTYRELKKRFPEDDFEITGTAYGEIFKCLDCDRSLAPKAALENMIQHLGSGTHKLKAQVARGRRKRQKNV